MKRLLVLLFFIPFIGDTMFAEHTSDLFSGNSFIVNRDIILGEEKTVVLECNIPRDVKRTEYIIEFNTKKEIGEETYYFSDKYIEVGSKEQLFFPSNVFLFDDSFKKIIHPVGKFQPQTYSKKVYWGSKKKQTVICTHSKTFYIGDKDIQLQEGEGMLIPPDCVVIHQNKKVTVPNGYLIAPKGKGSSYQIACTSVKKIEVPIVPVVKLPANYKLTFNRGKIINAIIVGDNLEIKARSKQIFDNIVLTGSLKNEELKTEWFGCNVKNSAQKNSEALAKYVLPSAIATVSNVCHSSRGVYQIYGGYPLHNLLWGFDHSCIKDFKGITIHGKGKQTVIKEIPQKEGRPADIFNIVDSENLTISNLSVTCQTLNNSLKNGVNAFSLIHSIENIIIESCRVYHLPYVEGQYYPDGGKAFTIQCGPNTNQSNIVFRNNFASNVSYGLDYTKTVKSSGDKLQNIFFENNVIENAIVGAIVHEWISDYEDGVNPIYIKGNLISNSQVGICCQTSKSCIITGNTVSNSRRPSRLLYYQGVYGILTLGAYNTTIEDNTINMKDCDSFFNISVYSYYPQYHGSVKNLKLNNNRTKGKSYNDAIQIGKKDMTKQERQMLQVITIDGKKVM